MASPSPSYQRGRRSPRCAAAAGCRAQRSGREVGRGRPPRAHTLRRLLLLHAARRARCVVLRHRATWGGLQASHVLHRGRARAVAGETRTPPPPPASCCGSAPTLQATRDATRRALLRSDPPRAARPAGRTLLAVAVRHSRCLVLRRHTGCWLPSSATATTPPHLPRPRCFDARPPEVSDLCLRGAARRGASPVFTLAGLCVLPWQIPIAHRAPPAS
ncbi:hypothetical protein DAI22_11g146750 [Oryza sativa Japonica Group]|nr:hypothetical protein DAI22_11g146750 [Oryza sativa Japonica Group]